TSITLPLSDSSHPHPLHSFPTRRSSDLIRLSHHFPFPPRRTCLWMPRLPRKAGSPPRFITPCAGTTSWCCVWRSTTHRETNGRRSEEHTSELQSRFDLVCRLLLEKKKQ